MQLFPIRKTYLRGAVLGLLAATLAACSSPTPYREAAESKYGYQDQKLEENRYRVTFAGNHLTKRSTVENYMLYRAAEVTANRGFDYFQIVSKETDTETDHGYGNHGPSVSIFGGSRSGGIGWRVGTSHNFGGYDPEKRFTMGANIVMRHGDKPGDDNTAYDAQTVLTNLKGKIARPQPKKSWWL